MTARIVRAEIWDRPIDPQIITAEVTEDKAGAIVTFTGVVRNHDDGRAVTDIDYSAHPTAARVIGEILGDIAGREGAHAISCVHRTGHLTVGDVAMVAVVAASHRAQAFSTVALLVDEVKRRLPVWKKQQFPDGTHEWTGSA
ncbi:molybdenum cofactor biosynthesis protein MoaE [Gleimia hominis]|uniref:Molybdenum cofactor biosynthesis protein MoaE n=1 Tax=Gleimia hominis TaxID=595468 RepID=A0ABU3IBS3_9ACTO|nr:molybdenum cofactor biosynthesis protein MoaE [Gleimia hominis]MDT3767376.1 molybdenum cofactor biosynthesis protein MoaE [Gleimia hominis]